jgi:uncharacterized protein YkwD
MRPDLKCDRFRLVGGTVLLIGACAASACVIGTAAPVRSARPIAAGPASPMAEDVVVRTNAQRTALKLPALRRNEALMLAAQLQADQMAAAGRMAHELPEAAYPSLDSRLDAVGYRMRASGENVAEGYPSGAAVLSGWMASPGHRDNIVSTHYTEMGAGVATAKNGQRFYAQVFASPR